MRVNSSFKGFFNNRLVMGSGIVLMMVAIFLVASSFTKHSNRDLRVKQTNILIRDIGHKLLLQAGDKTSRVLPVTEIEEGTFELTFDDISVLNHDSLMSLSQQVLGQGQFPSGYTVTLHDCSRAEIVYGFQINNSTPSILACKGRMEPRGCYIIQYSFPDFYEASFSYPLAGLVGSGMLLLTVGLLIGRFGKKSETVLVQKQEQIVVKDSVSEFTALGKFLFDVKNQQLLLNDEVISLTDKECKILELLNSNFGELTPRETLMQVWINEGVITGRSLDMFISKLRKKLSADPELSITNVHAKGYKLEKA